MRKLTRKINMLTLTCYLHQKIKHKIMIGEHFN